MKFILILKIIIIKIFKLNLTFLKREISGYPKFVKKFENDFAEYVGKNYGISFCNGTSSIEAALYALNFSEGDEILIPSSIFHAAIGPIKNLNYKPVFVDIDKKTLTIDCNDLEKKITNKSKCLIIVHPWGYPCNMEELVKVVKKNNLKLIEDCSHAHGALYDKKKVGSFADISCFSLQGNKSVAAGEGGISLTDKKEYLLKMSIYGHFNRHEKELNNYDSLKKFSKTGLSKKLRANPLGITMAAVDLDNLDKLNKEKQKIYNKIDNILLNYKSICTIHLNDKVKRGGFFGGYPIIFNDLNNIETILKNFNKFKINLVPNPWMLHHKMEVYTKEECPLPITENIAKRFYIINIPYLLNFNFKKLENCLWECKNKKLIN